MLTITPVNMVISGMVCLVCGLVFTEMINIKLGGSPGSDTPDYGLNLEPEVKHETNPHDLD